MPLPPPAGGSLQVLLDPRTAPALRAEALRLPAWDLTPKQVCDLELLLNGAFSPLRGFLGEEAHTYVCKEMRLPSGALWPIPVTLDVTEAFATKAQLRPGARITLRHPEGMPLAVLAVRDVWRPDRAWEAEHVFGTRSDRHPGVFQLLHQTNPVYVGGEVEGIEHPPHHTYRHLRPGPAELRAAFARRGWERVVAFQTRNPMHRAHIELTRRAAQQADAAVLLHPVVGRTSPGDLDYFTRVRCYEAVLPHYDPGRTMLALLPLAMRMGGPREALWHAIIRRNHGATHFIVGRDHAGPKDAHTGKSFYGPYDAQRLVLEHEQELGIGVLPFEEFVYLEQEQRYVPQAEVPAGAKVLNLSGTELRQRLRSGLDIPAWFSYPEVVEQLRRMHPPRARQGFTVFFTGLSGSGKSTIANILVAKLMEDGSRPVTLLDGDIVRKNLSSELGFSREHRDVNVRRIGFVASEITKNGGVAVCAPIAPYDATRRDVRSVVEGVGSFVLVHVSTPLAVCEERDRKGLYAQARAGLLKEFTGIDDPYEAPQDADVVLDTTSCSAEQAARQVMEHLAAEGYVAAEAPRRI
ncbi:MAG: bifunctional sulfate adenylyltransferase/adenylylsulfate kinase [Halobacteriales archaeon]|nr:bifunctional sulfate adenylyltransferase/adenylylsulfate kinase [Halobacteriales archaeon]